MTTNPEYYWCLTHKAVEDRDGCRNVDRIGPFATREEAAAALDKVAERNDAWDNDPKWKDADDA